MSDETVLIKRIRPAPTVSLSECERDGDGWKYVVDNECPECGGDLDVYLRQSNTNYDWEGFAEQCADRCGHREA